MCIPDFLGTDPAAAGGARLALQPAVILSCVVGYGNRRRER